MPLVHEFSAVHKSMGNHDFALKLSRVEPIARMELRVRVGPNCRELPSNSHALTPVHELPSNSQELRSVHEV